MTEALPPPEGLSEEALNAAPLIDDHSAGNDVSLNALMEKDPLSYTDADIEEIVKIFRRQRHNFLQAEAEKASTVKVAKAKQPKPALPAGTKLTLAALGFGGGGTPPAEATPEAPTEPPKPALPAASAGAKPKPLTIAQLLAAKRPS